MVRDSRASRPVRISVWLAEGPHGRRRDRREGEQAGGLDRERMVQQTVRLLDDEGLASFSMRRLAGRLGVTAMSLYWYVESRDDLLELALDAVNAEQRLPDPDALDPSGAESDTCAEQGKPETCADQGEPAEAGWRRQLRQLAVGYRALLLRHPWVSPMLGQYLNLGPHATALAETAERILAHSGLPPERLSGGLAVLFRFVHGYGAIEANWTERCRRARVSPDGYAEDLRARLGDRGGYAAVTPLKQGPGGFEESRERDFAFGLDCVFAGIEAMCHPDRPGPA